MSPFVYYMWNRLYKYALVLAFFYATMTGCVYAFFGLYPDMKGLGITVCIFNALFFLYEIKCLVGQGMKTYFESYWNCMDLLVQSFSFCIAVVCMSVQNTDSKVMAWLRIFAISLIYLRAITWFRVFKRTRYLITMMIQVFRDMVSFLAIFLACIVGFSIVWRLSPLLQDPLVGHFSPLVPSMYDSFYTMLMLIFGNPQNAEADGSHFKGIRLAIISIISLVQVLTFLNFLIAFINHTHDTVEDKGISTT